MPVLKKPTKVWLGILCLVLGIVGGWRVLHEFSGSSSGEFGLYLVESGELILSDREILAYNSTRHELTLTTEGVDRVKGLDLYQRTFALKLHGAVMYEGAFWSAVSSRIYEGVVIVDILRLQAGGTDILTIEPWYPPGLFPGPDDPRLNPAIFNYFQTLGKLTH